MRELIFGGRSSKMRAQSRHHGCASSQNKAFDELCLQFRASPARLAYHGVRELKPERDLLSGPFRFNLTFRLAGREASLSSSDRAGLQRRTPPSSPDRENRRMASVKPYQCPRQRFQA
jgi:hypothetical protein